VVLIATAGVTDAPCLEKRLLMAAGRKDNEEDDMVSEDEKVRLVLLLFDFCVLEEGVAERSVVCV
jgi:hypothetical protein